MARVLHIRKGFFRFFCLKFLKLKLNKNRLIKHKNSTKSSTKRHFFVLEHGRPANDCHSLSQCTTAPQHNASGREKAKKIHFSGLEEEEKEDSTPHLQRMHSTPTGRDHHQKNVAALRPSSTNQAVSLWRAFSVSRRAHLFPLGALTSNPKESSGSAACLEEKKSALPLAPSGTNPGHSDSAPFSKT